jgi:hypothetical protein
MARRRPYATEALHRRIVGSILREVPPGAIVVHDDGGRIWLQDPQDRRVSNERCQCGWARRRVPVALPRQPKGNPIMNLETVTKAAKIADDIKLWRRLIKSYSELPTIQVMAPNMRSSHTGYDFSRKNSAPPSSPYLNSASRTRRQN